ncbi:uncharacterized protein YALI1_D22145g [Yarrowia lipolytica]|uniref:Uncharacterized protein n=1 Tax=Yarrowia lipolytica TaxID=4952 RepID=A0A1D8NF12_YARLL|nr:hypothetical protein YALI1_D22145g [Yarrowia lipolytica]
MSLLGLYPLLAYEDCFFQSNTPLFQKKLLYLNATTVQGEYECTKRSTVDSTSGYFLLRPFVKLSSYLLRLILTRNKTSAKTGKPSSSSSPDPEALPRILVWTHVIYDSACTTCSYPKPLITCHNWPLRSSHAPNSDNGRHWSKATERVQTNALLALDSLTPSVIRQSRRSSVGLGWLLDQLTVVYGCKVGSA